MLLIEDLQVKLGNKKILKHVDLEILPGETHILFGPNGSGKTSLLMTIMGYPQYKVTGGKIMFKGEDITHMTIDDRARLGIGMSYQRPPSIQGLKTRKVVEACSRDHVDVDALAERVNFTDFLDRDINVGFSGGEIKRSELLQLMAQDADLALFDEPESGVDLENISLIGNTINGMLQRNPDEPCKAARLCETAGSCKTAKPSELEKSSTPFKTVKQMIESRSKMGLIITHTGFILDYVTADKGLVLYNGVVAGKGHPAEIFKQIRKVGYRECARCAA
ncbi:MAG: ABC transporter ATP-binding protein [Deltaproteobacteria bacterium]|nr:ABC transporter ATP-binding protein [Deltaproteobacteria bacterium]